MKGGGYSLPVHLKTRVPVRDDVAIAAFLKSKFGNDCKTLLQPSGHKRVKGQPEKVPLDMFERLAPDAVRGYTLTHAHEGSVLLRYDGPVNPDGSIQMTFREHAVSFAGIKPPHPTQPCTVYAFAVQEYSNHSSEHLSGALNVMPTHVAYRDADKEMQKAQQDQGGLAHASFDFAPNTTGMKRAQVALKTQSVNDVRYHYNNPDFMASTYRVYGDPLWPPSAFEKLPEDRCQEEAAHVARCPEPPAALNNLWKGIVYIPSSECKRMGLPIYDENLNWELHKEKIRQDRRMNASDAESAAAPPVFGAPEPMDTGEEDEADENFQGTTR